jgi:hypothetical protein
VGLLPLAEPLRVTRHSYLGVHDIPINRIVGSVDRAAAPHSRQLHLGWHRKREHERPTALPASRLTRGEPAASGPGGGLTTNFR